MCVYKWSLYRFLCRHSFTNSLCSYNVFIFYEFLPRLWINGIVLLEYDWNQQYIHNKLVNYRKSPSWSKRYPWLNGHSAYKYLHAHIRWYILRSPCESYGIRSEYSRSANIIISLSVKIAPHKTYNHRSERQQFIVLFYSSIFFPFICAMNFFSPAHHINWLYITMEFMWHKFFTPVLNQRDILFIGTNIFNILHLV